MSNPKEKTIAILIDGEVFCTCKIEQQDSATTPTCCSNEQPLATIEKAVQKAIDDMRREKLE